MAENILDRFKDTAEEEVAVDTSKKLRVGIIGTGWIAEAHIVSYLNMPDVEIVAGADLVEGKAEAFFKKFNVEAKCYRSHKEMLDDESLKLDAVSVCTYNRTHAECAIYALKKGVNVLLEKPMCVTLDEAVEICKAEKESQKVLSIGFQPRLDENMKMIKKIVDSGELGKIYYIQTGGGRRRGIPTPYGTTFIEDKTAGIGALGDIGCYSLDMVLNAIGYPKPLTVSGYKSNFFGTRPDYYPTHPEYAEKFEVDDFAAAFIRLEGDIILDFRIAWAMNMDTPGDTIILGTKGGLRIPSTECWNGSVGGPMVLYHEICGQQTETVIPIVDSDTSKLFDKKIRSFLDAVKNGTPAPVPTSQIIYNQAIIDGIFKSAEAGREIEIEVPEI
ncbi:MAG: Gfo/Idh/MocA family oxidoreductase [Fusicatenibacter sp.]|nr:Gfo/Idh/MocA family oxidoreductase [Lachnospiraceae bacterium]MDY2936897.1 Gfo/Idh/MocA family oxidoreductase [Fusicatenibacter sp.]